MGYATNAEVAQEFKAIDFAASGATVVAATVDRFITEASAEIDGYVFAKYITPVDSVASPNSFSLLKSICIALVSTRIKEILSLKTGNPNMQQFQQQKQADEKARLTLDKIRKGEVRLTDAVLRTTADGVRSFNSDHGKKHIFKIGRNQW